jgi:ankyrin repeat protein
MLVENDADLVVKVDLGGNTLIHVCAEHSDEATMKFLLAAGCDPCYRNNLGQTALHIAALHGQHQLVHCFVAEFGAPNLLIRDLNGQNPLHSAVQEGRNSIVELIIDCASDDPVRGNEVFGALDVENRTPYDLAVELKNRSATNMLQQAASWYKNHAAGRGFISDLMADIQQQRNEKSGLGGLTDEQITRQQANNLANGFGAVSDHQKRRLLNAMRHDGCVYSSREFIEAGGRPGVVANMYAGKTPIHYCAERGNAESLQVLLEANGDPNVLCRWKFFGVKAATSPLHLAVDSGVVLAVTTLLDSGAEINFVNRTTGDAPLHMALADGKHRIVAALLKYGADVFALNKSKLNAIAVSNKHLHRDCMVLLEPAAFEALAWSPDTESLYAALKAHEELAHPSTTLPTQKASLQKLTQFESLLAPVFDAIPRSVEITPVSAGHLKVITDALLTYEAWEESQKKTDAYHSLLAGNFHLRAAVARDAIRGLLDATVALMRILDQHTASVRDSSGWVKKTKKKMVCYKYILERNEERPAIERKLTDTEKYAIVQRVKSGEMTMEEAEEILSAAELTEQVEAQTAAIAAETEKTPAPWKKWLKRFPSKKTLEATSVNSKEKKAMRRTLSSSPGPTGATDPSATDQANPDRTLSPAWFRSEADESAEAENSYVGGGNSELGRILRRTSTDCDVDPFVIAQISPTKENGSTRAASPLIFNSPAKSSTPNKRALLEETTDEAGSASAPQQRKEENAANEGRASEWDSTMDSSMTSSIVGDGADGSSGSESGELPTGWSTSPVTVHDQNGRSSSRTSSTDAAESGTPPFAIANFGNVAMAAPQMATSTQFSTAANTNADTQVAETTDKAATDTVRAWIEAGAGPSAERLPSVEAVVSVPENAGPAASTQSGDDAGVIVETTSCAADVGTMDNTVSQEVKKAAGGGGGSNPFEAPDESAANPFASEEVACLTAYEAVISEDERQNDLEQDWEATTSYSTRSASSTPTPTRSTDARGNDEEGPATPTCLTNAAVEAATAAALDAEAEAALEAKAQDNLLKRLETARLAREANVAAANEVAQAKAAAEREAEAAQIAAAKEQAETDREEAEAEALAAAAIAAEAEELRMEAEDAAAKAAVDVEADRLATEAAVATAAADAEAVRLEAEQHAAEAAESARLAAEEAAAAAATEEDRIRLEADAAAAVVAAAAEADRMKVEAEQAATEAAETARLAAEKAALEAATEQERLRVEAESSTTAAAAAAAEQALADAAAIAVAEKAVADAALATQIAAGAEQERVRLEEEARAVAAVAAAESQAAEEKEVAEAKVAAENAAADAKVATEAQAAAEAEAAAVVAEKIAAEKAAVEADILRAEVAKLQAQLASAAVEGVTCDVGAIPSEPETAAPTATLEHISLLSDDESESARASGLPVSATVDVSSLAAAGGLPDDIPEPVADRVSRKKDKKKKGKKNKSKSKDKHRESSTESRIASVQALMTDGPASEDAPLTITSDVVETGRPRSASTRSHTRSGSISSITDLTSATDVARADSTAQPSPSPSAATHGSPSPAPPPSQTLEFVGYWGDASRQLKISRISENREDFRIEWVGSLHINPSDVTVIGGRPVGECTLKFEVHLAGPHAGRSEWVLHLDTESGTPVQTLNGVAKGSRGQEVTCVLQRYNTEAGLPSMRRGKKAGASLFKAASGLKGLASSKLKQAAALSGKLLDKKETKQAVVPTVSTDGLPTTTKRMVRIAGEGLGLAVQSTPDEPGCRVVQVWPGTVAEQAGVEAGEVLVRVDGTVVLNSSYDQVVGALGAAGAEIDLVVCTAAAVKDAVLLAQKKDVKGAPAWWGGDGSRTRSNSTLSTTPTESRSRSNSTSTTDSSDRPRSLSNASSLSNSTTSLSDSTAKSEPAPMLILRLVHPVMPSDSLTGLSLKYGVSVEALRKFNKMMPSDQLFARKELLVPEP